MQENGRREAYLSKNERIKMNNDRIRKHKRRKNAALSVFSLVGIVVIFVLLAITVFFRVDTITVNGTERYSAEQIIEASGVKTGDRLLLIRGGEVAERITAALVYAESVHVKRDLPGTVVLTVTDAYDDYAVDTGAGFVIFSSGGKVLAQNRPDLPENCTVVAGLGEIHSTPGGKICDADSPKYRLFRTLIDTCAQNGLTGLTYINIEDEYDIHVVYGGRITLKLGSINNLANKALTAVEVLEREVAANPNKVLIIDIADDLKAYARPAEHTTMAPDTSEPTPEDPNADEPVGDDDGDYYDDDYNDDDDDYDDD